MKDSDTRNDSPDVPGAECEPLREAFQGKLQGMLDIANLVGSVMQLDDILHRIVEITTVLLDVPVCSIYLLGPRRQNLTLRASVGLDTNAVGVGKLPLGRGLPGIAAQEGRTIVVEDVSRDPRHEPLHGGWENKNYAYICAPLYIQERLIGVISARRHSGAHGFSDDDRLLFETVSKLVSIVIEKSQMYFEKVESDRLAAISISLSEVAHYIKNLLQSMKGGSYFVDQGLKKGDLEMARKGWDVLRRGNKKIASLTENMLNFSRDMQLKFEMHNINAVIYDILGQIDDASVERGVAILPEADPNLPPIEIDQEKIYDVLLNLIANAIDAIPPEKEDALVIVRSRMGEDHNHVAIEVEDNGSGIPPEVQPKIFNLFFSTKAGKGTGIGLAVSRKIIERHNGLIGFETTPGKGTRFVVRLPLYHEDRKAPLDEDDEE